MPGSSKWYPSLKFPHQNPVHTAPRPNACYMPRPSHSSWTYCIVFISTINLCNSLEQNLSWERCNLSASQEISIILWKPKFHFSKSRSVVPIRSRMALVHPYIWHILILCLYLPLNFPSSLSTYLTNYHNLYWGCLRILIISIYVIHTLHFSTFNTF